MIIISTEPIYIPYILYTNNTVIRRSSQVSDTKATDIYDYIKPAIRGFGFNFYILHVGTNYVLLEDLPEITVKTITEALNLPVQKQASGDKYKEQVQKLSNLLNGVCNENIFPDSSHNTAIQKDI